MTAVTRQTIQAFKEAGTERWCIGTPSNTVSDVDVGLVVAPGRLRRVGLGVPDPPRRFSSPSPPR